MFDVGHGFGSFDFQVADAMTGEGFFPDTISTDLHSLSAAGPARDLPTTMGKLLSLGMPLPEIVSSVTSTPAGLIGRGEEIGSLAIGREADLAIFDVVDQPIEVEDSHGRVRRLERQFRVFETIRAGVPWGGPYPHPGPHL